MTAYLCTKLKGLCNQLGYVFQNEHLDFDRKAIVEIVRPVAG